MREAFFATAMVMGLMLWVTVLVVTPTVLFTSLPGVLAGILSMVIIAGSLFLLMLALGWISDWSMK